MKMERTSLDGVVKITLDIFEDHRGRYIELYDDKKLLLDFPYRTFFGYDMLGRKFPPFVQDDVSMSFRNVLRGIHGDNETWKLITCLYGKFYLVIVNCDQENKNFGTWQSFILSESNGIQVLVPPKYGVAHLCLTYQCIFHYKQSTYYDRSKQFSYRYDDKLFNIWWPIDKPILSRRDEGLED